MSESSAEHAGGGQRIKKSSVGESIAGCGCLVVIVIAIAAFLGLFGGDGNTPVPKVGADGLALVSLDKGIQVAQDHGAVIYVKVGVQPVLSASDVVTQVGMIAEKIGRSIKAGSSGVSANARLLNMQVRIRTIDRLGKVGEADMMWVTFPIADLRQAEYANLSYPGTLNLAEKVEPSRVAIPALVSWCEDPSHSLAESFCERAGASAT